MTSPVKRVARGIPTGGQFASLDRAEAELTLATPTDRARPTAAEARTVTTSADIRRVLTDGDVITRAALATNPAAPGWALARVRASAPSPLIDLRLVDHPNTDAATLRELSGDRNAAVAHHARMHANFRPEGLREKAAVALERFIYRAAA